MGTLFLQAENPSGEYANDDYGAQPKKYNYSDVNNNKNLFEFLFNRCLTGSLLDYLAPSKYESFEEFSHVC